ncbi:MAG TPA: AmmeMemoRadiSam system protein B [Acidimicrobiia bacterium]|nr:AmmeMemoRadiSam system protein B [Acidimicrobiia bacterium]
MTATTRRRPPAVAGTFYPDDAASLAAQLDELVPPGVTGPAPKALIVPHAGYVYSGPVAGHGYATLRAARDRIERVVLLGPAHRVPVRGLATTSADEWVTPLGAVTIDDAARQAVLAVPNVEIDDRAHADEHSLEVHLPFLQHTLRRFSALPLVVGRADPETVAAVLDTVWGGPETLIVVSTDLSHYLDHATASARDRRTAEAIVAGRPDMIRLDDACGAHPVRGLLLAARRHGLRTRLLDLRNSGDTAGPSDRVVGYGAFSLSEATP